jgi:hypothetical protein
MGGTGGGGTGGSGTGGSGGSGTGGSGTGGSGGSSSMTGAGGAVDDPGAVCNTSEAQPECPERCPTFASCFVAMGQNPYLYYRVDDQRFDCDGLKCDSAVAKLADYCCERGEFAPSKDDGGGCMLPPGGVAADAGGSESSAPWLAVGFGLCVAGVGRYRRRRARQ